MEPTEDMPRASGPARRPAARWMLPLRSGASGCLLDDRQSPQPAESGQRMAAPFRGRPWLASWRRHGTPSVGRVS